jgi:hypothetical protein
MKTSQVIAASPLVSGLSASLLLGSFYTQEQTSLVLCIMAIVVGSAGLGALITHFPGRDQSLLK